MLKQIKFMPLCSGQWKTVADFEHVLNLKDSTKSCWKVIQKLQSSVYRTWDSQLSKCPEWVSDYRLGEWYSWHVFTHIAHGYKSIYLKCSMGSSLQEWQQLLLWLMFTAYTIGPRYDHITIPSGSLTVLYNQTHFPTFMSMVGLSDAHVRTLLKC